MESTVSPTESIILHGITYKLPRRPTVVVCVDGFDPSYLEQGIADGILPNLASFVKSGFHATADAAMPSFTNPNNVSIITGVPTAIHGIAGNYFLDRETGEETMVVDDALLRGSTILAELAARGVRVAAITAKDKLRRIINHGLGEGAGGSICFSAERADDDTLAWMGRAPAARPDPYSADLSLFVLDAGVRILRERRADLLYLTLSDFVQHKHAPGTPEADAFMAAVDSRICALVGLGAVVAVTGDHGMSAKTSSPAGDDGEEDDDGQPNVVFLQDELERRFGAGCARVICPITDPFVRHHGALGGFVRVHVRGPDAAAARIADMVAFCAALPQVEVALPRAEAAARFETPEDCEGDIAVVARKDSVIGARAEEHDLAGLGGHRLRSHGGLSEQRVPLLMSTAVADKNGDGAARTRRWRNFNIFDLVLNYGQ